MSFITRSTILIFILVTIFIVSAIYDRYIDGKEGFKPKDPFAAIAKIGKFFKYLGDWFKWLGDIMKCSIETLIGLPNCIMFYMFDLFIGTIAMIIQFLTSFSPALVKARKTTWNIVTKLDNMIYKTTSFRFTQYPKSIIKKCYKCKNKKMPTMKI